MTRFGGGWPLLHQRLSIRLPTSAALHLEASMFAVSPASLSTQYGKKPYATSSPNRVMLEELGRCARIHIACSTGADEGLSFSHI
jgi:hypothetical protein